GLTTGTMKVDCNHERTLKAGIIHLIQLIGCITEYFNKSYILSVLTKKHNSLIKLQEAMANTEMDFGYGGISIAGADGVYVFQKINGGVILYGIPLEGTRIISARLNLSSETIIPVDMFDALMCKVALSMDGYFSP
ncbi:hypothetical protein OY11_24345, partial [Salmonella enterica]|nr:hypothetical protein [Salmonella enterica]